MGRTRREYVHVGSLAPSMAPTVLPMGPTPRPPKSFGAFLEKGPLATRGTKPAWIAWRTAIEGAKRSLSPKTPPSLAGRRAGPGGGTFGAMDGADEPTWTYLRRVPPPGPVRRPPRHLPGFSRLLSLRLS